MQRLIALIVAEEIPIPVPPKPSELAAGINYFFALLPDDEAQAAIAASGERLRKAPRTKGASVSADRLHLALCPRGKPERLLEPIETALLQAAAAVRQPGFNVTLDGVTRFSARDGQFPLVLCADSHSCAATLQLRKAIAAEQARVGLQVSGVSSYLPHVVLLEGPTVEAIEDAITPICWKVRDFVLIRSFFGQSRHQVVGRWPLSSEPEPAVHNMLDELATMGELPDIDDDLV